MVSQEGRGYVVPARFVPSPPSSSLKKFKGEVIYPDAWSPDLSEKTKYYRVSLRSSEIENLIRMSEYRYYLRKENHPGKERLLPLLDDRHFEEMLRFNDYTDLSTPWIRRTSPSYESAVAVPSYLTRKPTVDTPILFGDRIVRGMSRLLNEQATAVLSGKVRGDEEFLFLYTAESPTTVCWSWTTKKELVCTTLQAYQTALSRLTQFATFDLSILGDLDVALTGECLPASLKSGTIQELYPPFYTVKSQRSPETITVITSRSDHAYLLELGATLDIVVAKRSKIRGVVNVLLQHLEVVNYEVEKDGHHLIHTKDRSITIRAGSVVDLLRASRPEHRGWFKLDQDCFYLSAELLASFYDPGAILLYINKENPEQFFSVGRSRGLSHYGQEEEEEKWISPTTHSGRVRAVMEARWLDKIG